MACKRSAVRSRLPPPKQTLLVPWSPSSRGLGHDPFTVVTGVRIPLGTPALLALRNFSQLKSPAGRGFFITATSVARPQGPMLNRCGRRSIYRLLLSGMALLNGRGRGLSGPTSPQRAFAMHARLLPEFCRDSAVTRCANDPPFASFTACQLLRNAYTP